MVKRVALLAMVLLLCTPALVRADLTSEERADIKSLIESSKALRMGERYLAGAIKCCSTPEARPALANALSRFRDAQVEHFRALGYLLHTGTENQTPKPNRTWDQWHTSAWFYLDRYALRLEDIQDDLAAARAFHTTNATYQDYVKRARDVWVQSARYHVGQMDRANKYLSPWPALAPGKTVETVAGPHGDYREMHWRLNRGKNYALEAYIHVLQIYRDGVSGSSIRDAWVESSSMLDALDKASGLIADVTFTDEEASEDRFCRVLRATKVLTVTAGQKAKVWGDAIAKLLPDPYDNLFLRFVDSWKFGVDLGAWNSLVFPESARCTSPFLKE